MRGIKVGIISTLIVAGTAVTLTGCSLFGGVESATTASSTDEAGKVTAVYGEPWINSVTYGMVKEDTEHDEKNDWYLSVNYSYLKDTSLPDGKESEGAYFDAENKASARVSDIIKDDNLSGHDGELVKGLYSLYTDWDSRDKEGVRFIEENIKKIREIESMEDMNKYLSSSEAKRTGVNLVSFDIDYDYDEPEYYSYVIIPTELSLNDAAEYSSRTSYGDMLYDGLNKRVSYVLGRLGYSEDESKSIMEGCTDLEKSISSSMKTREFKSSNDYVTSIKNKRSVEEIKNETVNFPLSEIMNTYGLGGSKRNFLLEPDWLKKLDEYYTQEHISQIRDYLTVSTIQKFAGLSDKESFLKVLESYGVASEDDREATENYADNFVKNKLTDPVGKAYCEKYTDKDIKTDISSISKKIIDSYKELVGAGDALSDGAKQTAVKKLDALQVNAVYPEKWEDYSGLTVKTADEGGTLINATLDIDEYNWQKKLEKMGEKKDPDLWDVDVTQASVTYWPTQNCLNIFAGITDSDYYRSDMSKEEKYAGIGMLIACEIDHAIDDVGCLYDEKGKSAGWWSDEDRSAYEAVKKRVVDQYSGFKPFKNDTAYNGERVASRACAEIAGMQAVLDIAEKENFDKKEFFKAYASANRMLMTEKSMEIAGLNYTDPLAFLKVNETVKQFESFFEASGATEGDRMYTSADDRIRVW